ncbi:DUF2147 domain-containing protein [Kordiimonas pumila]|uniref:DUF2147 domain-containing protein n=1 Tax=Kordiimonas pumila TaxID=2161677 RepID=A0ABV7D4F9_9PROT|nr:DUF2147 domain-containing protein [Kordiimonas pumila]
MNFYMKNSLLAGVLCAGALVPVQAEDQNMVAGYWLTEGQQAIVEIAPCGTSAKRICGTIVWAETGAEQVLGGEILKGFRPIDKKASDKWAQGKVAMSTKGRGLDGKLDLIEEGLKVSICKGSSCTYSIWSRPSSSMTAAAGLRSGG